MRTYLECYPCLLRQAVQAAQMATDDPGIQHAVMTAVLRDLQDFPQDARPVDMAPRVHAAVRRMTGCADPYERVKSESNHLARRALPVAEQMISASPDPLLAAAKLAAAGNIADSAVARSFDFEAITTRAARRDFALDDYAQLRSELAEASHILYLADNAGEIVFDRLLLERLGPARVTVAVKERPLLNDATIEDAQAAEISSLADLVSTGDGWPDADLSGASDEFRTAFLRADLIVAKGQANYEALSESQADIFFLLTAKCSVLARQLGVAIGDLVLKRGGLR